MCLGKFAGFSGQNGESMGEEAIARESSAKKKKKRKTGLNVKAKKKEAKARAVVMQGTGKIKINSRNISTIQPFYLRKLIEEPLIIAGETGKQFDINVNVSGGGVVGQAMASRGAIAKALVLASRDKKLKESFIKYDRMLLVDDVRKVEPKKPLGTKARKKKQKSKR